MARTRTANISGELITNTLIVTSTGANVSNAVVKTGDTMTGLLNVANNLVVTGNVGIGTSLPGAKIQIDGNSDVSDEDCMLRIVDRDTSSGSQIPTIQFLGGSSANQIGLLRVNDQLGYQFATANSTVVTFAQNGNVGIGTTSPAAELDVKHATDPEIHLTIDTHGAAGKFLGDADGLKIFGQGASNQLRFYTSTTERMRLDASGNLQLAATAPVFPSSNRGNFTIGGSASSILFLGTGNGTGSYVFHEQSVNGMEVWNTANGYIRFGTNAAERGR